MEDGGCLQLSPHLATWPPPRPAVQVEAVGGLGGGRGWLWVGGWAGGWVGGRMEGWGYGCFRFCRLKVEDTNKENHLRT